MPFTPKFVDMVRNLTTVTGTGAVTPGSAASGFSSFATLNAGDQFYYCIQGVDKPAEREVGRGTMQSNGTITREAIGGGLTNFTTGTKTIALVTAAEWFAKVDAGGTGASFAVGSLAELAALPAANGAAAMLTAKGREGLFVFDAGNQSAKVTADPRKGMTVAPASAPTGASGAWLRKHDGPINVMWFGAAADFVTDDLPAFDAALAVIKSRVANAAGGGALRVPAGRYYLSSTLNIHVPVHIIGEGSAQGSGGTLLRFGKNVSGVVFNYANTHGDGAGTQGNSCGSRMEGLQLWGGNVNVDGAGNVTTYGANDSIAGHGVRIRTTFVTLRDIFTAFWGGDGFNINATSGSGAATNGNANDFYLEGCQAQYNHGYGYLANGTDANAGTVNTCSAIENSGGGFIDYSFLGNSYIQCHSRDNGRGGDGPTGICSYGGTNYYWVVSGAGSPSTTVPGTDASVWAPYGGGGGGIRPWASGMSWANPSPYGTNPTNVNGRNVFTGCYAESAQAPCQATQPSLFVGGLLDEVGVIGSATWIRGTSGGGITAGELVSRGSGANINRTTRSGGPDGNTIFTHSGDGVTNMLLRRRDDFYGRKALDLQLDNSFEAFNIGLEAAHRYGYGAMSIAKLFVGNGTLSSAARLGIIAAPEHLNGETLIAGSMYWNIAATPGQPLLYLVTSGGVGGADAVVASAAPLGLAQASAAEIRIGTASNRFISPFGLFDAAAPVTLTDGATITIDGSTGINFNLTLGGNRTLANPTNMKPGQSGRIRVRQDATGSRTLAFGSAWLFAGGDPTLSTGGNAIDVIAYFANSATEIEASIVKALA